MNAEKLRVWIQTLGLVAIPIVVGFCTNSVANSNAKRDVNARMVELAAQILGGPANDSTRAIRRWAVDVLNQYSDVPLSASAESSFVKHQSFVAQPGMFFMDSLGKLHGLEYPPVSTLYCDSTGRCRFFIGAITEDYK